MIKKLATVATLALLTAACAGTHCQTRGCGNPCKNKVVVSDAAVKEGQVLFDFDSATLTPAGEKVLAGYVDTLKNGNKEITVVGYTDSTGPEEYNLDLSKRRAEAAKAYFVKKGVNAKNISTKGLGETNFVADNETAKGRAQNRRIEILTK